MDVVESIDFFLLMSGGIESILTAPFQVYWPEKAGFPIGVSGFLTSQGCSLEYMEQKENPMEQKENIPLQCFLGPERSLAGLLSSLHF